MYFTVSNEYGIIISFSLEYRRINIYAVTNYWCAKKKTAAALI